MPFKEISSLYKLNNRKRVFVLGVDGLGGSGKTTYALLLKNVLKNEGIHVEVLHIDDFIHPKEIRYDSSKLDWECYYNLQWRYDYLRMEILTPIQSGSMINKDIELYDKQNDSYIGKHITLTTDSILMIEGVFLQRSELRSYFDYVIYIDANKESRLQRVIERDTYIGDEKSIIEKYEKRYFPAEDQYILEHNPKQKANYIKEA